MPAPAVVQTYGLTAAAIASGVKGLTVSFAGSSISPQDMFDVMAALALVSPATTFDVCDNALKQVLDAHPLIKRF